MNSVTHLSFIKYNFTLFTKNTIFFNIKLQKFIYLNGQTSLEDEG